MRKGKKWMVAGVDIGAATAKAVILECGQVVTYAVMPTGYDVVRIAEKIIRVALRKAGVLKIDAIEYVVSTGYGRHRVSYADKAVSEITCHGKGAKHLIPNAKTVVDIGGQDSKVIALDEEGNVTNFVMNDRCAAGTGRFLEMMAMALDLKVTELGRFSKESKAPCRMSSTCAVFAESEMVSLRAEGAKREDLAFGIAKAVSLRVAIMGRTVGFKEEIVFTGGVAENEGVKIALEQELGQELIVPPKPQIVGAIGAALLAESEVKNLGAQFKHSRR